MITEQAARKNLQSYCQFWILSWMFHIKNVIQNDPKT